MTRAFQHRSFPALSLAAILLAGGCATEVTGDDDLAEDGLDSEDDLDSDDGVEVDPEDVEVTAGEVSTSQVCIFEAPSYQGPATCFGNLVPGQRVTIPHLFDTDVGNDKVSSFKVKKGFRVRFYSDTDKRGAVYDVNGFFGRVWDADLRSGQKPVGNDSISSIEIKRMTSTAAAWDGDDWQLCIYEHANYEGKERCWGGVRPGGRRGQPTIYHAAVGNDQASSYKVQGGVKVTFFREVSHDGEPFVSDGYFGAKQQPNMGSLPIGNDSLSSFLIEPY